MKKLILSTFTIITLLFSTQINAQAEKGFFFSLNAGYNFGSSSQISPYNNVTEVSGSTSMPAPSFGNNIEENIEMSFGKGTNFGGAIGYMFNKNIGAELGVNYLIGTTTTATYISLYNNGKQTVDMYSKMLQFKPTFILTAGYKKINPYTKFGILIGKGSLNFDYVTTSTNITSSQRNVFDGQTAIGFHAGVGVNYVINSKTSLFGEINMVNMSYTPTKGTKTQYSVNGEDLLNTLNYQAKNFEFVDSINNTITQPTTESRKALKQTYAFGSFGINFGVKYSL